MYILLVLFLEASVVGSSAVPTHICPKGTHLLKVMLGWEVCPLCEDGVTYMTDHWHTHLECFKCTRLVDPEVETLVTECNITHDTVIHCRSGFYRRLARNPDQSDQCVKCSECENPTRLCEGFYDTVCCRSGFEAVLNKDNVYVCNEKPIVCTQGQYYNPHNEQCFPCPPDTYMSEDPHNNKECKLCQKVGNNSSRLLLQACNSTHSAIVDCKPGYFKHSSQESPLSDDDCSPCHTCHFDEFVGRECTSFHDTVCCDSPEMTVVDNNTGPVCVPLSNASSNTEGLTGKPRTSEHINICGQNEFIIIVNDSFTCQRCRDGTYNDDLNHNRTSCKDCSEFSGRQLPANCRTGNDVCKNTDSGISSNNRIECLVSLIFAALVLVASLILKWQKRVRHHKQGRTKQMLLLEMRLLYVVIFHMFFSCMLSVVAANTPVKIEIVSTLTMILCPGACYLLYQFWNQTKSKNGDRATDLDKASTESTQVTEGLNCTDTTLDLDTISLDTTDSVNTHKMIKS